MMPIEVGLLSYLRKTRGFSRCTEKCGLDLGLNSGGVIFAFALLSDPIFFLVAWNYCRNHNYFLMFE